MRLNSHGQPYGPIDNGTIWVPDPTIPEKNNNSGGCGCGCLAVILVMFGAVILCEIINALSS